LIKDAPRFWSIITNQKVDEIMEKVEQDRYISSYDIGKDIDYKTVSNHLEKAGYKKTSIFRCHMI